MKPIEFKHLHWRAGFGPDLRQWQDFNRLSDPGRSEQIDSLFKINREVRDLDYFDADHPLMGQNLNQLSQEEKNRLRKESKVHFLGLNKAWLDRMASTPAAFREKMAFFWHGHFACRNVIPWFNYNQNNKLRRFALASFRDLLFAISQDAAMLQFLNNQQNRKAHPNENFAREVMELFTLGRGNYTEKDVTEAARAFTGWGYDYSGEFVFRQKFHDTGRKEIFGKRGNFRGEDVLNMLLENRQTAKYLSAKIYRYFVREQENPDHIAVLAKRFYESDYNIADLMHYILSSDWFYEAENIGSHIKSPVELIAGMMRPFRVEFKSSEASMYLQKSLGQVLFQPPGVDGWPQDREWIDSSSLITRMRTPEYIFLAAEIDAASKDESMIDAKLAGQMDYATKRNLRKLEASFDLDSFLEEFSEANSIADFLLLTPSVEQHVALKSDAATRELIIKLLSSPEYQLC
jgi:uncharacterized protein (DUF1800 family)